MLDCVPPQLRVLCVARPNYAYRAGGTIVQAPAPERSGLAATPNVRNPQSHLTIT
jgi:transposase